MRKAIQPTLIMIWITGLATFLHGQSSEIQLYYAGTETPAMYANVCWQALDAPEQKGYAVSDEEGRAYLQASPGTEIILSVTHLGCKPVMDTMRLKARQVVEIEEDVMNLGQVTISGTRTPHTLKNAPVLTQLVTEEEIQNSTAETIEDVLETEIPGMEMSRHGHGTPVMNMQGLDPKYTLILIDGERMAGETRGNVDFSRINTAHIERVEILRGASSALYGSNAMGGVVNIITKKPDEKFDVSASLQYGQANERNSSVDEIENIDEGHLKTFYKNQDWPNLNGNVNIGFRDKNAYSNTFINFKSADAYQLYDTKGQKRYYAAQDTAITTSLSETPTSLNGFRDYTISQKLGYDDGGEWAFELRGNHYNQEQFDFTKDSKHDLYRNYTLGGTGRYRSGGGGEWALYHNADRYDKYDVLEKKEENVMNYSHVLHNTKMSYVGNAHEKHNLLLGLENLYQTLETDMFVYDVMARKKSNDMVLLAQDEYTLTDSLMLVGGVRGGYHSAFDWHASPSLTARLIHGRFNYRASYARGYRSPTLKELYMNWDHMGMFTLRGNEGLRPEENNYYALSADYTHVKHLFNATLITSYNHIYNKIDGKWSADQTVFRYANYDQARLLNTELIMQWRFFDAFRIKGGYVYAHLLQDKDAVQLSSFSPHAFTARLDYSYKHKSYRLNASLYGKITGKKSFEVQDDGEYFEGEYYQVSYPAYSLWDMAVMQRFGKHFSLKAGIKNLFGYTAPIVTFNSTASPGRRFFVALGYQL